MKIHSLFYARTHVRECSLKVSDPLTTIRTSGHGEMERQIQKRYRRRNNEKDDEDEDEKTDNNNIINNNNNAAAQQHIEEHQEENKVLVQALKAYKTAAAAAAAVVVAAAATRITCAPIFPRWEMITAQKAVVPTTQGAAEPRR